jgi:hypothetical protein
LFLFNFGTFIFLKEYRNASGGRPGMKKVLLIGLVLVICILAFPQGVLAETSAATVNANIDTSLSFTATGRATEWALNPTGDTTTASNADGITFAINSNAAWGVHPKLAVGQDGIMKPNVPETGAANLQSLLQVQNLAGTDYQYVDNVADVLQGSPNAPTGETKYRAIRQHTLNTDRRLTTSGNYYTVTVTFECIPVV